MADKEPCGGCRDLESRVRRLESLLFGEATEPAYADDSPLALTMADLVTPRQLANVRRLAQGAGVDADRESRQLLGAETSALNRNAADRLIKHLALLAATARRERGEA